MDQIFIDRVLDLACTIQQIPSPTFSEGQKAIFVFEQFKQSGLQEVRLDGAGNVLAKIPGQGAALPAIVSAHLDTVFPASTELTLRKEAGKIIGPGIGDNSLGVHRYKIITQTAGGHSWVDFGKPSAIHEISRLVNRLEQINLSVFPRTTYNVGVISGGTSVNTIASEAQIELDLRSEDVSALQLLTAQVHNLVDQATRPGVRIKLETIGSRPAGDLPPTHPLVMLAQKVLSDLGRQPRLTIGSTDANIPLSRGLPAICIGITQGYGAHTTSEYIQTEPVATGISQLIELVKEIFRSL